MRYTLTLATKNIAGSGLLLIELGTKFIDCSFSSRGTETGQKLCEYLEGKEIEKMMFDHWKAYAEFLP